MTTLPTATETYIRSLKVDFQNVLNELEDIAKSILVLSYKGKKELKLNEEIFPENKKILESNKYKVTILNNYQTIISWTIEEKK